RKNRSEPSFSYLNRSARPAFDAVREAIESWFARYPGDRGSEFRLRIRSNDDTTHSAAVFELFVHALLTSMGWTIDVHPDTPGSSRRPDFLATSEFDRIYVEATTIQPTKAFRPNRLEDAVLDAIDELDSPDFFIHVETRGELRTAPRRQDVVEPFAAFMAEHDHATVLQTIEHQGFSAAPSLELRH